MGAFVNTSAILLAGKVLEQAIERFSLFAVEL
jgi:hypothetical protein